MKQTNWIAAKLMAIILVLLTGLLSQDGVAGMYTGVSIDEHLLQQLNEDEGSSYAIVFHERPDLSAAYSMDWQQRGRYVMEALQRTADRSQAAVKDYLSRSGAAYQPFWISNVVIVESGSRSTFDGLLAFEEIAELRTIPEMGLIMPEETRLDAQVGDVGRDSAIEPNISHVMAPAVWALGYDGQGMIVGGIDSGARYTHEAVVNQYRGSVGEDEFDHNYNWWDGAGLETSPVDTVFHGTHILGTAVGSDGGDNVIGVAPGAQWIACRGCTGGGCPGTALLECAQFMAAPTDLSGENPDPELRPHVINNSWGDCGRVYDGFYQGVIDSWHAAGIVPVFANGNAGNCGYARPPGCNTVGNPGRYANVLGIGSTGTSDGAYATHSNWGPTDNAWNDNPLGFPTIKPQVSAPGVSIRSAIHTGDNEYGASTGTSMSAPHVAGLVALMWQAAPCLRGDYVTTSRLLMEFSDELPYPSQCGGEGPNDVPNNATGWGEINALTIVESAIAHCGAQLIKGVVTVADDGEPIADAEVRLAGPMPRTVVTDADGYYEAGVMVGSYTVSASKLGFYTAIADDVVVQDQVDSTADLQLEWAPIAGIDPISGLWFDLLLGEAGSSELVLDNTGHIDLTWEIASDQPADGARDTLDETLAVGDFALISPAHGGSPLTFSIPGGLATRGQVTGITFSGTVSDITNTASWAAHTCLIIESPDGSRFAVGGESGTHPECATEPWSFQGSASAIDGQYSSSHNRAFESVNDLGQWTLTFINDWNTTSAATMNWSDVTLTLHKTSPVICTGTRDMPWLSVEPASGSIAPAGTGSTQVTVDSAGLGIGLFETALCVTTNAENAMLVPIPVTVTVSAAPQGELDVSPLELTFGDVPLGGSATASISVSNATGDGPTMLTYTGHQAIAEQGFEVIGGTCTAGYILLTGDNCTLDVRFTPESIMPSSGVLIIDVVGQPPVAISLQGSGTEALDGLFFDRFEH